MTFEYKMLNYLIQPSAADVTKQGMLNVRDIPNVRIAAQVHDELMCMAPERRHGKLITDAMCDMKFKVPMLAEVKMSRESWARVK
jgi:DNA polymerase I-like protein with 3'-5' exonuclease and polymerase domains